MSSTGSGRARRAGATVRRWRRARAAYLARHPLCAAVPRPRARSMPATVVDHVVPHRGDQKLFWDESNWAAACASAATTPRRRARAAGAAAVETPGGRSFVYENGQRGPGAPRAVCGREIQEGGIRALRGGIRGFLLARAHRIAALL